MLDDKDCVEEDGQYAEEKLDKVECASANEGFVESPCVQEELKERKETARKVQQDSTDGETYRALATVVQKNLRHVLDERDGALAVASEEKSVPA